jgi:hypothetical protein
MYRYKNTIAGLNLSVQQDIVEGEEESGIIKNEGENGGREENKSSRTEGSSRMPSDKAVLIKNVI